MAGVVQGVSRPQRLELRPQRLELHRLRVPLLRVHRSSRSVEVERESTIVLWHDRDGGGTGLGECAALSGGDYATESAAEAWDVLAHKLGPALVAAGASADAAYSSTSEVNMAGVGPAAEAAIRDAALDAGLRGRGERLATDLANQFHTVSSETVRWCAVVSCLDASGAVRDSDEFAAEVSDAIGAGASMVKLKINPETPMSRMLGVVDGLAAEAGRSVAVAADANGSLTRAEALALDDFGLLYLEQPLPWAGGLASAASLRGDMATPLALDESLLSITDVDEALRAEAADVISVKPARLGGCVNAARAAAMAHDAGVSCFVGGMFELGVGRAAALAVASLGVNDLPTDLGPTGRYVLTDICEPVEVDESGAVVVPTGIGNGIVDLKIRPEWVIDSLVLE